MSYGIITKCLARGPTTEFAVNGVPGHGLVVVVGGWGGAAAFFINSEHTLLSILGYRVAGIISQGARANNFWPKELRPCVKIIGILLVRGDFIVHRIQSHLLTAVIPLQSNFIFKFIALGTDVNAVRIESCHYAMIGLYHLTAHTQSRCLHPNRLNRARRSFKIRSFDRLVASQDWALGIKMV